MYEVAVFGDFKHDFYQIIDSHNRPVVRILSGGLDRAVKVCEFLNKEMK